MPLAGCASYQTWPSVGAVRAPFSGEGVPADNRLSGLILPFYLSMQRIWRCVLPYGLAIAGE